MGQIHLSNEILQFKERCLTQTQWWHCHSDISHCGRDGHVILEWVMEVCARAFVTHACSWSTEWGWYYELNVINLCANSTFTLLRFWHLLLPFTFMLWAIMNHSINGNEKNHLSTIAVISHSPVSWHERTNSVCYRWHLSCITLCISSSFGKSCFHICWYFFFFGFHVEILLKSTLGFTVQLTWCYMLQKENIQMPSEIWERPFYRVKRFSSLRQSVVGFSLL